MKGHKNTFWMEVHQLNCDSFTFNYLYLLPYWECGWKKSEWEKGRAKQIHFCGAFNVPNVRWILENRSSIVEKQYISEGFSHFTIFTHLFRITYFRSITLSLLEKFYYIGEIWFHDSAIESFQFEIWNESLTKRYSIFIYCCIYAFGKKKINTFYLIGLLKHANVFQINVHSTPQHIEC